MSELSNDIFRGKNHKLTSSFGKRAVINTSAGNTSSFHSGADYGTYNEKLSQYAVTDGKVISCGTDNAYGGAKYVWIEYPSLGVKMLHYHLDKICVKKGQQVDCNTALGTTGKSGMATGIHLHLGIKRLSGGDYIDPEKWSKDEYISLKNSSNNQSPLYKVGNYKVNTDVLFVRKGAGKCFAAKKFTELSADAQNKIKKLTGKNVNGYVKGLKFTASQVKFCDGYHWGKTPSGWVALEFCEEIR